MVTLALTAFGAVVTPSCGPPFKPASLIDGVRVLTIEADPPYALPGETITLKMRYSDGRVDIDDRQPLQITWIGGCFNPPGDQYFACFEQLNTLLQGVSAGDVAPGEFLLQGPAFDTFTVTLPEDIVTSRGEPAFGPKAGTGFVFFTVCAGTLRAVDDAGDTVAGSFPFGCFDATGKRLGAESYVPGYTVVYAYEDGRTNAQPEVNGLLFSGEPIEEMSLGAAAACDVSEEERDKSGCAAIDEFVECETYDIDVDVPRDVGEADPDATSIDGEPLGEVVWVNYYAEAGSFEEDIRLINDASKGYQSDHSTVWVPPAEKGRYAIWAVVHDSRGGATTLQRFVDVQ